jgi:predicted CopG family antitoxin
MFKHKHNMPFKTLTITEEAYNKIKMLKEKSESFTELFLRLSDEKINVAERFLGSVRCTPAEASAWRKRVRENRKKLNESWLERQKKLDKRKKELGMI